ncbi:MAG: helix-turn-helix domain-containing protein [Firmicutes bacterium]|jgi:DNA-binding transcriptional ArsR family regulator|nr:helix-turn-helix domain-containing protein [Bacillota bacterium]
MKQVDLLLHPVRMRIIQAFLGEKSLTTSQLADDLTDIPKGSLYRHVGLLKKAGVLRIVSEKRVRATIERTYMLSLASARLSPKDISDLTPHDLLEGFLAYVSSLIAEGEHYLSNPAAEPVVDGFGFRVAGVWLSDEEYASFSRKLADVYQEAIIKQSGENKKRRVIYTVIIPG